MNTITKIKTNYAILISIIVVLLSNSCCKDLENNNPAGIDLSGYWESYNKREDENEEGGPLIGIITQTESKLSVEIPCFNLFGEGTVVGDIVNYTVGDGENNIYSYGNITSANGMSGTWSEDGPFTGTWRSVRITETSIEDLSGNWNLYQSKEGQVETGPMILTINQEGNDITLLMSHEGRQGDGVIADNVINLTLHDSENGNMKIYLFGKISEAGTLSGTWIEDGSSSGTWRAVRI